MRIRHIAVIACAALGFSVSMVAADTPGVTDKVVKLGNTAPYSGPASFYGTIARAALAYFDKVNSEGGVHGRQIEVISLDDAYSPPKAVEQTRKLVESENVLAIFMPLGSPTSAATQAYLNQKKVPQIFVTSGAERYNEPRKYPWSIGWNVSYADEGRIYGKYIADFVKDPKVSILYANDDFGRAVLEGLKDALSRRNIPIVAAASYEISDATVDSQITRLKGSGSNAFVNAATPKFAAQAVKAASAMGWKPLMLLPSVSNSIDPVLTSVGLENAIGAVSASYSKQPSDPQWKDAPDFKEWLAFMDKYYPSGSKTEWLNAYGYSMAYAMHQALERAGRDLDRDSLMKALHSMRKMDVPMLLPGVTVSISEEDHGPIKEMQMMRFDGKTWVSTGELISGR
ncbi:branched-chain amino acid ABC transporter substrate-binding protein [Camelimonas fluminis]|nr:branched-chain amino acid ABC transporter substrate-binding protein [Camelimonas fluminis]